MIERGAGAQQSPPPATLISAILLPTTIPLHPTIFSNHISLSPTITYPSPSSPFNKVSHTKLFHSSMYPIQYAIVPPTCASFLPYQSSFLIEQNHRDDNAYGWNYLQTYQPSCWASELIEREKRNPQETVRRPSQISCVYPLVSSVVSNSTIVSSSFSSSLSSQTLTLSTTHPPQSTFHLPH